MNKLDKKEKGSKTAKDGFNNEKEISNKFNNFLDDTDAKDWLEGFGYLFSDIKSIKSEVIPNKLTKLYLNGKDIPIVQYDELQTFKKADILVQIELFSKISIFTHKISCKKADQSANYNQLDKRKVSKYKSFWDFDEDIKYGLELFTGEIKAEEIKSKRNNRLFMNEIPQFYIKRIFDFFDINKKVIISDIIRGRGFFAADWMLVTRKVENSQQYLLKNIHDVISFYSMGKVELTKR